ncbi:MAG: FAD-dependent oxidoreductase, partial [Chitinophagaceae bacterium]|nr:FAD-dependent oxidoreductase [Chitinophagaceae bacterium]
CFEPHVGDSIFKAWAAKEKNLKVIYGGTFEFVQKNKDKVVGAYFRDKKDNIYQIEAAITIDATDLGDVFANAGCKYDLGTEDSTQSNEKIAPGKSNIIQDLTWAATLQDFGKGADMTIPKPPNYDATKYYCSTTEAPCNTKNYDGSTQKVLNYGKLPTTNGTIKYMLNWPAHGNDFYLNAVEMKPLEREHAYTKAKEQTLGFIYFLQTTLGMKHIGLSNEFGTEDKLALMPYNREGRRLKGLVRLNINHIQSPYNYALYRTGIAVGDYPVDHHHAQYKGKVPPIPFPKVPAYNIPLGALIPEKTEGLIVCEKGISVSNIANGTTRLQPVVLLTGQAAGLLAATCVKQNVQPAKINIRDLQQELVRNKCYIMPFTDVKPDDAAWEAIQYIGAMGIIKGKGISEGWENKMFFYPDSLMKVVEIEKNLSEIGPLFSTSTKSNKEFVDIVGVTKYINNINASLKLQHGIKLTSTQLLTTITMSDFKALHLNNFDTLRPLTKKEIAVLISHFTNHLKNITVDIQGKYKRKNS